MHQQYHWLRSMSIHEGGSDSRRRLGSARSHWHQTSLIQPKPAPAISPFCSPPPSALPSPMPSYLHWWVLQGLPANTASIAKACFAATLQQPALQNPCSTGEADHTWYASEIYASFMLAVLVTISLLRRNRNFTGYQVRPWKAFLMPYDLL